MSKSQKFIYIISILSIISAILGIALYILVLMGMNLVDISELEDIQVTENDVAEINIGVTIMIVSELVEILLGIHGIHAAHDAKKYAPVLVVTIIEIALVFIGIIFSFIENEFKWTELIEFILPLLMLFAANNIRKQAKTMEEIKRN